ncbi:hypothetical protein [Mycoplasma seminis]|uniref:Uncharacterized protein n=1 Tax=Mycoplasma seminis TaxID=512749 RepID=A0ABY9HBG8_9MOLU|nr:hypothetical protein [Mycoplasma seminis]WLP85530.1 hypothetical protein Q8852_04410 [Mycoplasma seminis]
MRKWRKANKRLRISITLEEKIFSEHSDKQINFENNNNNLYKTYKYNIKNEIRDRNIVLQDAKYTTFWLNPKMYFKSKYKNQWMYLILLFNPETTTFNGQIIEFYYYQDFYNKYFE